MKTIHAQIFSRIRVLLFLGVLLMGVGQLCQADPTPDTESKPARTKPRMEFKENPVVEDFIGKWVGKWDRNWEMSLTVAQDPQTKKLSALYQWVETHGEGLKQERHEATLSKNILKVGDKMTVRLSAKSPDRAQAIGNFSHRRMAVLTRKHP